jgi:hypothetical protein
MAEHDEALRIGGARKSPFDIQVTGPRIVEADDGDSRPALEVARAIRQHCGPGALEGALDAHAASPEVVVAQDGELAARRDAGNQSRQGALLRRGGVQEHVVSSQAERIEGRATKPSEGRLEERQRRRGADV